jgi:hypothetical protein
MNSVCKKMLSVSGDHLRRDIPIVVLISDGGCGGLYATVEVQGCVTGHKTMLTLPTRDTWKCLKIGDLSDHEFNIIHLHFTWGIEQVYVSTTPCTDTDSTTCSSWKSYIGEHRGLESRAKCVMRTLHYGYYCKDGFLGMRDEPPSDSCSFLR